MEHVSRLERPRTFEDGGEYVLLERGEKGRDQVLTPVRFSAYDPCPAFVIVRTEVGRKRRCLREELFVGGFAHHSQRSSNLGR